jgi:hypothetical protein
MITNHSNFSQTIYLPNMVIDLMLFRICNRTNPRDNEDNMHIEQKGGKRDQSSGTNVN